LDVGQSQTFIATASGGSGTYLSYHWYVDGQLQSSKVSTFVYSSSTASLGTRSITVTVTDSLGVTSPPSSPATVTVNAALIAPAVTFILSTVDQGQTSVLSNSTVISTGTGPYSYEWFEMAPGTSYVVTGSGLSFSFVTSGATVTGTWSFILQVTDSVGAAVNSSAASVMVDTALVASVVMSSPSTVDKSQISILTSSSVTTGTGPYSYQWFEMAPSASIYSAIGGATLASYSFMTSVSTATGVWHFELNVTDATGAVVTSNAVTVTVNLAPSVSISPSSVTLDVGQSQVFTSTASGDTGSLSYLWYLNDQAVGTGVTYDFSAQSTGSDSIYVTVTDSASSPYTATSNSATVTVNSGIPAVTATSSLVGITGYKLVFKETMNNSLGSPATIDYYWTFSADKWNGTQWVASGISGSTALATGYSIPALTKLDLPYYVCLLNSSGPSSVAWGEWLGINCTFHWTYGGTKYSTNYAEELNAHPGDIAGAAVTFPYFGAQGIVNINDVFPIALYWLQTVPPGTDPTSTLARADIIAQGIVNINDVFPIATHWLKTWNQTNAPPLILKAGAADSPAHSTVTSKPSSQNTLVCDFPVNVQDAGTIILNQEDHTPYASSSEPSFQR
jgi:hypothetical protein